MTTPQTINWTDAEKLDDACKDGRDMLLWNGTVNVGTWCAGWRDVVIGRPIADVTHGADVGGPGGG